MKPLFQLWIGVFANPESEVKEKKIDPSRVVLGLVVSWFFCLIFGLYTPRHVSGLGDYLFRFSSDIARDPFILLAVFLFMVIPTALFAILSFLPAKLFRTRATFLQHFSWLSMLASPIFITGVAVRFVSEWLVPDDFSELPSLSASNIWVLAFVALCAIFVLLAFRIVMALHGFSILKTSACLALPTAALLFLIATYTSIPKAVFSSVSSVLGSFQ